MKNPNFNFLKFGFFIYNNLFLVVFILKEIIKLVCILLTLKLTNLDYLCRLIA